VAADPVIITIQDIRDAGICASGARRWFEAHGLDFRDFMENGISEDAMLATGDARAQEVVNRKRSLTDG